MEQTQNTGSSLVTLFQILTVLFTRLELEADQYVCFSASISIAIKWE